MSRNVIVYVTRVTFSVRICHTFDIFGQIGHTLQPKYGHLMCLIRLDLVFLCSQKRTCHLPKMRKKMKIVTYMSHVYFLILKKLKR